jgi:myo-inositol-1(or 4)-monophosphatase
MTAARRGLDLARGRQGADDVRSKGGRDIVTAADVAVEDLIRGVLSEAPGAAVIGEERGGQAPACGSAYWLVDPICGTRNYASGIPLYSVNVALVEDGQVTVAASGDASAGDVHVAERGRGAWVQRNGAEHRLTASGQSRTVVIEVGGCEGAARRERAARGTAAAITADSWDLLALGSTLSLPYVAAGRVAGYVVFWASALHTAAGSLLAAEAGATVTDIDGHPWTISSDSVIASADPGLHADLLDVARDRPA